jgi:hypothetical protein
VCTRKRFTLSAIFPLLVIVILISEWPLEAYADPGSGAMFIQVIPAGLLGGLFHLKKMTSCDRPLRTLVTRALLDAVSRGEVTTAGSTVEWLSR